MKPPFSITARISLLFALSAASILMLSGALFEHVLNQRFLNKDTVELNGKMAVVRSIIAEAHKFEDQDEVPLRLDDIVYGHPGIIVSVQTAGGILFSTGNQQIARQLMQTSGPTDDKPTIRAIGRHVYRYISGQVSQGGKESPAKAVIALEITDDQNFMTEFRYYLWGGVALVSLILGWLGWVEVRHGLSPLRQLSGLVGAISSKQLDKPLDNAGTPLELHELVSAFNSMRSRLHESFRHLSEFSSDIAHELRTPIHNLLIQTQVTLAGDEDIAAYRNVLQSNEEEYQRLSRMITDMLFLAKADNKQLSLDKEPIHLAEEVARLFDFYEAMASELDIRLEQQGTASIKGDRLMIQRALSNLLSNALRFTPAGMTIHVDIRTDPDWVYLSVANPGPEIPAEQQARIFERLYRIDPSRREGQTDNVGLGLAITRSIVEMHGGRIGVESKDGWVTFVVRLPI